MLTLDNSHKGNICTSGLTQADWFRKRRHYLGKSFGILMGEYAKKISCGQTAYVLNQVARRLKFHISI
jgi:hypothetical protein